MDFGLIVKQVERFTIDNSPAILTAIGVAGTVTTAYLSGKASIKAHDIIVKEQTRINLHETMSHQLTKKDKVNLTWQCFVPPVGTAALTIAAIIGANHINSARASAMAAAFTLSQKALGEYKDKVVDKIGEGKAQTINNELVQEKIDSGAIKPAQVIVTGGGEVLCYDSLNDRTFMSSMEALKRAENDVNRQLIHEGWVGLSDFYLTLGLSSTRLADNLGWCGDDVVELNITSGITKEEKPVLWVDFHKQPQANYRRFR